MTCNRLHIGVAGLSFGARVHAAAFKSLPNVELVAIAGTDKNRAQAIADKFGIKVGCGSLEELFSRHLDAVTLALPPKYNEKAAAMAVKKKIPILAEKPLAASFKTARELSKKARGLTTMVDFHFAELAPFKKLKKIIDSCDYGSTRHVNVTWHVESLAHRHKSWSWKVDADQCGGIFCMLGSHFFYLAEWLFGPIDGIFAQTSSTATQSFAPAGKKAAPDSVFLVLRFSNGVEMTASISNASRGGIGHRWEVVFEEGTAVLHNPSFNYEPAFTLTMKNGVKEKILSDNKSLSVDKKGSPFRELAGRFIKAVRANKIVHPDFSAGTRVQQMMEAAICSAQNRKWIPLKIPK